MPQKVDERLFDPVAYAEVQDHLRSLVLNFDSRGLLDPQTSDDIAFPAMVRAAAEDQAIASSLQSLAGKPSLYLYVEEPASAAEKLRQARRNHLVDQMLPADSGPSEEVHAMARAMEIHPEPEEEYRPDFRKVGRVQSFIEGQSLMDSSDDSMIQVLRALDV